MRKGQGTIFLGGPPLVKAATGEIVSAEDLGGADVHSRVSGVTDHYRARRPRTRSASRAASSATSTASNSSASTMRRAARAAATTRRGDLRRRPGRHARGPTTCARSSPALVDGSEFDEFKALYGTTLVCGFAHIWGYPVGILANNGILFSESALKGAHFIELCAPARHPARVPAEHHRLYGRARIREPAASPRTAPRW